MDMLCAVLGCVDDETGGASHKAIFYRVLLTWQHLIRTKQTEKANLTREKRLSWKGNFRYKGPEVVEADFKLLTSLHQPRPSGHA